MFGFELVGFGLGLEPVGFGLELELEPVGFGLGRGLEFYDAPAVRRIVEEAGREGYSWSAVLAGVARSTPFQMRRAASQ